MLAAFQEHLDAVEPHLAGGSYRLLERFLEGISTRDDDPSVRCCDHLRMIVGLPISLRERHTRLHRFIMDPGSDD